MSSFQLKAEKREKLGSIEARRLKNSGKIPAVIYSKDGNINIFCDKREFEKELHKGNVQSRSATITIADKQINVIAHNIELDPVSDQPIHIDFINCDESKSFKVKTKINFINQDKSPGIKKGGVLHINLRKIEVACKNIKEIPESIDVDVGVLHVGSKVRASSISLPQNVTLLTKKNALVASIIGRGKSEDDKSAANGEASAQNAASDSSQNSAAKKD